MSRDDLTRLQFEFLSRGNANAAREVAEHLDFYDKQVEVVKGRKVKKGTVGTCFWLRRYDNSRYGDPWGIYSSTRIGIKTAEGETYFTALDNVVLV